MRLHTQSEAIPWLPQPQQKNPKLQKIPHFWHYNPKHSVQKSSLKLHATRVYEMCKEQPQKHKALPWKERTIHIDQAYLDSLPKIKSVLVSHREIKELNIPN